MEFVKFKRAVHAQFNQLAADEPNGLVGVTGLLFDADKLKRSINAALSMRAEANVVTRRYGLRQQVLYLMYYGEE
jgi:hypothetical protein